MRSTSDTSDALSRLSSVRTRIFVALTAAEAAALGRLSRDGDVEAIRALTKIRTALEHAITDARRPEPSALTVPPLRAKHYRARETTRSHRSTEPQPHRSTEPLRMAKADLRTPPVLDDYVPFRDEADGVYT